MVARVCMPPYKMVFEPLGYTWYEVSRHGICCNERIHPRVRTMMNVACSCLSCVVKARPKNAFPSLPHCRGMSLQELLSSGGWPRPQGSPLADQALECWAVEKLGPVLEALLACHARRVRGHAQFGGWWDGRLLLPGPDEASCPCVKDPLVELIGAYRCWGPRGH